MLGGHVRAVFTLVTIIFIGCVVVTLDSFREIPLWRLESVSQSIVVIDECDDAKPESNEQSALNERLQAPDPINRTTSYGALSNELLDAPKHVSKPFQHSGDLLQVFEREKEKNGRQQKINTTYFALSREISGDTQCLYFRTLKQLRCMNQGLKLRLRPRSLETT